MSLKKFTYIAAYLILPVLLGSFGSAMSSLTRVYVSSSEFTLSIFLGALVTSMFYARFIKSRLIRNTCIFIFGVVTPILYIQAANEIYHTGIQEYVENWSMIYSLTTFIGIVEIMLYIGILLISFFLLTGRLIRKLFDPMSKLEK